MIDMIQAFMAAMEQQPMWVQIWVNFLGTVNVAAILFVFKSKLPWIILGAIVFSLLTISWLHNEYGFVRLLGLPHIIVWTPMLWYFWKVVPKLEASLLKKYLYLLMGTNFISLVIDYIDVARYFLGIA
ncbi:MAG: hypothetical protein L3J32_02190 [Rhizobiaceae bacterium]|nr:hypothetical protein [Rhizobiaceae bacterium]